MKKGLKISIIAVCILLVLVLAGGLLAGNYFYTLALTPGSDLDVVLSADHNQIERPDGTPEPDPRDHEEWYAASETSDVYQTSYDGLRLHAAKVEHAQHSDKWAVLCHGYSGRGSQMIRTAMFFSDMGFSTLLPDARGCGESEGDYYGMGWHDRHDVVGWINEILTWQPDAQIVLFGVSMGGATVMMASGEVLPANVKAIVEDCGYTSAWDEFAYQMKGIFGLPAFPLMHFSSLVTRARAGYWLGEASAVAQVAKSKTPTLFIHGTEDTFVPYHMHSEVYEACAAPKEKIVVEGAGHGLSATVMGPAYWQEVERFLVQYLE